jgi:hypothetical protein
VKLNKISLLAVVLLSWVSLAMAQEDEWDVDNIVVQRGFVPTAYRAKALAQLMIEHNYGEKFIVADTLTARLHVRSLDAKWQVYGILQSDKRVEPQPVLLAVIDQNSAALQGIVNFTKNKSPYSIYIIPSHKKGYLANQKLALEYASLILDNIYGEDMRFQSPLKAKLRDGVWYINGSRPRGSKEPIAVLKISQRDGSVLGFSEKS